MLSRRSASPDNTSDVITAIKQAELVDRRSSELVVKSQHKMSSSDDDGRRRLIQICLIVFVVINSHLSVAVGMSYKIMLYTHSVTAALDRLRVVAICTTSGPGLQIHSFIHSFILSHITQVTNKTTWKINVGLLKVFHRTERPLALTTAHRDTHNTKHKACKWDIDRQWPGHWWVDPYLLPPVEALQVLSGWPSGRFQSVAEGMPVKASMDRCSSTASVVGVKHVYPRIFGKCDQKWVASIGVRWWGKIDPLARLSPLLRHWWSCHTIHSQDTALRLHVKWLDSVNVIVNFFHGPRFRAVEIGQIFADYHMGKDRRRSNLRLPTIIIHIVCCT